MKSLKHYYRVLFIQISLRTKAHLVGKILHFWTNFAQKGYFRSKAKTREQKSRILHVRISLQL